MSAREKNLGVHATRNKAIKVAADNLKRDPSDVSALERVCATVVAAVEASATPRRRGQPIRLRQRAAALIAVYGSSLSDASRAEVRVRVGARLKSFESSITSIDASPYVREHIAAVMIGVSVRDLLALCCDKETRRALGWPHAVGGQVLFLREALDPITSAKCLASLPELEPWPSSSWPKGWRA